MIQFGTGGWREIIGDKFTRENIHRVAHALSSMKEVKKVVISLYSLTALHLPLSLCLLPS